MLSNSDAAFWRFSFDPNRDPKAEMTGEERIDVEAVGCVSASLLDVAAVDPVSAFVFSAKVNAEPSDITMRCIS